MKKQKTYTEAELNAARAALVSLGEEVKTLSEKVDQIFDLVAFSAKGNQLNNLTYILGEGKGRATQAKK